MIRILLVDDQKSIRERLKSLLETEPDFDIVGMVDNGYDAIEQVKLLQPDVVLMDMEMPDIDGILATRIIAHSSLKTKVLVLSSYDSDEYVSRSIYSGANGYILKGAPAEEIRDAIRFVNRGYMQIAPGLFERFIPNQNAARFGDERVGKPFKSLERRDFLPGLELTGLNSIRAAGTSSIVPNSERGHSELIVDVTAQSSPKSVGWYQAAALVLAGLGLTTSLYFLRQGLHQPSGTIDRTEHSEQLHELPFTGKVEPRQPVIVNATIPGLIDRVQVNIGQTVNVGDRLLTIRNIDAERTNQAKIEQHRQQAALQHQAALQQATQQQQQALQQQQILIGEQQAAADRVSTNQLAIANYQRNLAPLHEQIAAANIQATVANQSEPSLLKQKRTTIDRAQAIYDRAVTTYERLAKYQTAGAISQERVEQAEKELAIAKSDLDLAQEEYDRTLLAAQTTTTKQAAQDRAAKLQQQLLIQEQAGQLQQLQAQLRVAQSDYQQISSRLRQLQQQKFAPVSPELPTTQPPGLEPTTIAITAPIAGTVIELPISTGNQVYTSNKLLQIANLQQLKVGLDLDPAQATLLKLRQRAVIKLGTGIDSQESTGSISKIAPSPTPASTTHHIEVEFTNPKSTMLVGQIGTVYFLK